MESKELQQVEEHIFKLSHPLKNTKVLEKNLNSTAIYVTDVAIT